MSTRRDALRLFAITSAALPALSTPQETKEVESQPGHMHAGPAIQVPAPGKPTFFQPAEFQTVQVLSECIIPQSDTPGAKEAGVALLIDKAIVARPSLGPLYRSGIADLNAISDQSYGKEFISLTEGQQIALLTPISLDGGSSLGRFFVLAKEMTIEAYYKTEIGLKQELGWQGNTYLASFPGCDHPEHQS
jgi:hypothetical protein